MHQVVTSEIKFKGRVFTAMVEDIVTPSGQQVTREVARHKGGTSILPIKINPEGVHHVILVKQYRHAISNYLLEIPAGILEPNEAPLVGAVRELQEETGYIAHNPRKLLHMHKTAGYCDEIHHLHVCEVSGKPGPTNFDPEEDIEVVELPLEAVVSMIFTGQIVDAKTIASVLAYREQARG